MEFYREVYKDSPRWDGMSWPEQRIIVYCEQGFGDIIQFSRFINHIHERHKVIIACPKELHRLFYGIHAGYQCIDKADPVLPEHDCHVLSMSLPFLLKDVPSSVEFNQPAYFFADDPEDLSEFEGLKIGIAWESKSNPAKSISLNFFAKMGKRLNANLFMLQDKIHDPGLIGQHTDLYSIEIGDFADTARLIAAVDVVVSVDTAVLHLAGAMGKPTWGLISTDLTDGRFNRCKPLEIGYQPIWYPTMRILFREPSSNWADVFRTLTNELRKV